MGKDAIEIKNLDGKVIEEHTLESVFNKTKIKINGEYKELHFSIFAEMWLQNEGIRLVNILKLIADKPYETMLKIVFAGLPPKEFRDAMEFKDFEKQLSETEAEGIIERTDYILACFFRHLLAVTKKIEAEQADKLSDEELKKNSSK